VGISLINHLQELAHALLRTYAADRLVLSFRAKLFARAQRLSLAFHDARGTADTAYRIQWDAPSIQYITIDGIIPYVTAMLTLIGMVYITASLDAELAIVALTVCPVLLILQAIYRKRLRGSWRTVKDLDSSVQSIVQEVLGAMRVVKAFGQEDREQRRFESRSHESLKARLRMTLTEGAFGLFVGVTTAVGTAAVFYLGVTHVQSGQLSLGGLLLITVYIAQLYSPLRTISKMPGNIQEYLESADRAFALLDEKLDVPEHPNAQPLARASGELVLRNVTFAYGSDQPVLRDVSFNLPPGARLGVVGATGSGKSTLASLLTRFYDPTSGEIMLDGRDLREYCIADLRKQFSIVLQEPLLFSATIEENIAYARPDATESEIIAAAQAANIHDAILRLPNGYQTLVGERGMRLSGGERQRIALARAFLKDAPILILDEPTSSVDVATERAIMSAMSMLMKDRTTIMVAHRLATLSECDALLVIEGGSVREIVRDVQAYIREAELPRTQDLEEFDIDLQRQLARLQ
ncbi:MAG: ABC transporter ATP-binding protein, partial [bacterium]|nr:ABC transporter ATP-binding protein [Candidatus Kapabacteria bacterium]